MQNINQKGILDYLGAAVAWICTIHCLAMPLLITFLPLFGLSFLTDETTEWILLGISLAVSLISLLPAYFKQHQKIRALLLFTSGIGLLVFSHSAFEDELFWKTLSVVAGAVLIVSAHFINRRLCRNCEKCKAVD